MESNAKLFFGGMPTAPDIKKLNETWAKLEPGNCISHEAIEGALGIQRNTNRYITVVSQWRRELIKHRNIFLEALPGVGYRVASDADRVKRGSKSLTHGMKKIQRGAYVVATTSRETLSDEQKREADHVMNTAAHFKQYQITQAKKLRYPELDQSKTSE